MLDFSLIGYGGYVAPRHISAIKETGNQLISAVDMQHNHVDFIFEQFPEVRLFQDFEKFNEFNALCKPDFVSICSPTDHHFQHIQWALDKGAQVICEKPIVINPEQLFHLQELEKSSGSHIHTILQLRSLKHVRELKNEVLVNPHKHRVELTYISRRNSAYFKSWKADSIRSGGLITNIGIHLFDLVLWIFGPVKHALVFERDLMHASGYLELEHAEIHWVLDLTGNLLPNTDVNTIRELKVDGKHIPLDQELQDLHRICYEDIINGKGLGIEAAAASIVLCNDLNYMKISQKSMLNISYTSE